MSKKSLKITFLLTVVILLLGAVAWARPELANITSSKTYHEILSSSVQTKLSPEYEFPTGYQYLNGCFGFAVGHILQDRGQEVDMLDMESRIQKPREELWKKEYKDRLAKEYNLEFKWSKNPELLFEILEKGESVVLAYLYPLEDGGTILHAVAAYSFDESGFWISETLSGQRKHLPYEEVFTKKGDQTQYHFARVVEVST